MAATTIGTSGLQFGLTTEGIGLVQSFSETRNTEKNEIRNNVGDIVGISYFNSTTAYSLSVAVTGNYNTQAGSALAVLANATTLGITTRIDSITVNKSNSAFVTVDIAATGYPNVS